MPEEFAPKLRQVDVLISQGRPVAEAVRSVGVTQVTSFWWRKGLGGLKSDQGKRLREPRRIEPLRRHWLEDNGERRREGLKVPQKQSKKGRFWLNEGS